jgi:hypothetical protein
MRLLTGLLVSASVTAGLTPAALGAIHTATRTASTTELQLVSRNANLFAIQRGADYVGAADLKRATEFSEYRATDWENKPVYDAFSQRVYAVLRGEQCQALELASHTAPDQSVTVTDVEIVERPKEECERVRGPNRS